MKVLLKKEVCGSIEQYTGPTKKALVLLKCASQKKKRERGGGGGGGEDANANIETFITIQIDTWS